MEIKITRQVKSIIFIIWWSVLHCNSKATPLHLVCFKAESYFRRHNAFDPLGFPLSGLTKFHDLPGFFSIFPGIFKIKFLRGFQIRNRLTTVLLLDLSLGLLFEIWNDLSFKQLQMIFVLLLGNILPFVYYHRSILPSLDFYIYLRATSHKHRLTYNNNNNNNNKFYSRLLVTIFMCRRDVIFLLHREI